MTKQTTNQGIFKETGADRDKFIEKLRAMGLLISSEIAENKSLRESQVFGSLARYLKREPSNRTYFRINIVINGYGFSREIAELQEGNYSGITEKDARAIVAQAKRKGFDAHCTMIKSLHQRIA